MRRPYRLSPVGWADVPLEARLDYPRFAQVVERARREVVREMPDKAHVHVYAMSAEAGIQSKWGEFFLPSGPVVIYQYAYEMMPDPENYYRQIKEVIRHEFAHAAGDMHYEPGLAHVGAR